ncbi:hypothetical protein T12_7063, partial [Trichinella patagoniensis]
MEKAPRDLLFTIYISYVHNSCVAGRFSRVYGSLHQNKHAYHRQGKLSLAKVKTTTAYPGSYSQGSCRKSGHNLTIFSRKQHKLSQKPLSQIEHQPSSSAHCSARNQTDPHEMLQKRAKCEIKHPHQLQQTVFKNVALRVSLYVENEKSTNSNTIASFIFYN